MLPREEIKNELKNFLPEVFNKFFITLVNSIRARKQLSFNVAVYFFAFFSFFL